MSIIDKAVEPIKQWIFGIALKKSFVALAKLIVSFAAAKGIAVSFAFNGIQFDLADIGIMTAALNSLFTMLRNWLKIKYPNKFGWL